MDNVTGTLLVTGDVAVGRDIAAGGNLDIKGEATFEHGAVIKGWLDAPNVKGPNKGIFESTDALNAAYPNPVTGWYAGVLVDAAEDYVECYYANGGAWVDSGAKFEGASDYPQKANRPTSPTNGHLAALDGNGDLVDSGKTTADFATAAQGAKADTALQEHQDISGKANKSEMSVVDGTGADADKTTITLKDGTSATVLKSHQDISGKQDVLTFDNSPTQGSNNPVKSGGVYSAINTISGTVSVLSGKMNQLDTAVETAQGYKADAKDYRDAASGYKTDAQDAKIAAEAAAESAATVAEAAAIAAAGRAVTDAVRVTFDFADTEKTLLCGSGDLLLMVVDGVGYANGYYTPSATGSKVVSFVFKDASEIPGNAFENNSLITALHIPSFVRNIGKCAFKGCSSLSNIDCEAMTPPVIGVDGISMSGVTLVVHGAAKSAYQIDDVKWKLAPTIKTYEYNT